MGGSKKGGRFEREVCTDLSLWWSDGKEDDLFWRSAGSGGRSTRRKKKGSRTKNQGGDITGTCEDALLLISKVAFELKTGYGATSSQDMIDTFPHRTPEFLAFVNQAQEGAEQNDAPYWTLISKRNQRRPILWMPLKMWVKLKARECKFERMIRIVTKDISFVGVPLYDFFEVVSKGDILEGL
jgi:hypothetical protein